MDIELLIKQILEEKKQKNPAYSLRALARDLKVDIGQLHRIINGKSQPTILVAFRVGVYLKLKHEKLIQLLEETIEGEK